VRDSLALALAAGMLAAVYPCGFALLPAYLTLLVLGDDSPGPARAVGRALALTEPDLLHRAIPGDRGRQLPGGFPGEGVALLVAYSLGMGVLVGVAARACSARSPTGSGAWPPDMRRAPAPREGDRGSVSDCDQF